MGRFKNTQIILTTLCGICLLLGFLLTALRGIGFLVGFIDQSESFAYLSVLFGSYFAVRAAWESLAERRLDVNFLMVFAAAGAVAIGHALDAGALLFLFSLSSTLESLAMARTRSAIEGLMRLRPEEATVLREGQDVRVKVKDLKVGDVVRVNAFHHIPADGTLHSPQAEIDESAMTGESMPVEKRHGDPILAGTQNLDRMLIMGVDSEVGDSTLEKIVTLVRQAQENKGSGERISTWFGQRYTFFVIAAFALSFLVRGFWGESLNHSFYSSLVLLVALSPCALVISTPASSLSALTWAARKGILVRGGEFIEAAGKIDTIALDKTGTLTEGTPKLVEICLCVEPAKVYAGNEGVSNESARITAGCVDEDACWSFGKPMSPEAEELLRVAAAAEQYSNHPIAEAIVRAAREAGLEVPEAEHQQTHSGLGVSATVEGRSVVIGQRSFFVDGLGADFVTHVETIQRRGMTVAIISHDGKLAALGLRDEPRKDAVDFLAELSELGLARTLMLTGDTHETAQAVASEVGIGEVHANLLPHAKAELIKEMVVGGNRVMMVGDGINDAPSLAQATVGVALGGLGSDITLNAADVVLMRNKLSRIPELIRLGRRTNAIIGWNLVFATTVILTLALGSIAFQLRLPFAVIGHEGSTVLVILNGLRLLQGPGKMSSGRSEGSLH